MRIPCYVSSTANDLKEKRLTVQLAQLVNGNFAFGEYLHTLRLASKLADLRVADANPIRAATHE